MKLRVNWLPFIRQNKALYKLGEGSCLFLRAICEDGVN